MRTLAETLNTRAAWVTQYEPAKRRLSSLAFWIDGAFQERYDHDIAGTPCERSIDEGCLVHYADRAADLFPRDAEMANGGASGAARRLGLPSSTLKSRMRSLGIQRDPDPA